VKPFKSSFLTACLVILSLLLSLDQEQVQADDTAKHILILPFQIHSAKDMAYLEKAISDMLSSRLEKPGQINIIKEDTRASDFSEMSALGKQHNADYVVMGSMSFFGDEVSTDARVYESGKEVPAIVFHEYGNTGDGVLVHIEKLADNIKKQVMTASDVRAQTALQEKTEKPVPSSESVFTWHSPKLAYSVVGMSAGDLDGDGRLEWVLAGKNAVYIYSIQADSLILETTLPQKNNTVIGVDVVDVDANHRAEIFITRKRRENLVDTAVIEWNGNTYEEQQKGLKWYFRAARDEQNRLMLLGQKQGHINSFRSGPTAQNLFEPDIYRFKKENGVYAPEQALSFPKDVNIYWVGFGDVMGNGNTQIVLLGGKDTLSLVSGNKTVEWNSAEPFGGSNVYLDTQADGVDKSNETDRQYLSQRIHVTDMNADGKADVIVPRNKDAGGRLFKKFRNYKSGSVAVLSWQETNLEIVWETSELTGYISDTWLEDVTQDGRPELAYCLVTGSGALGGQQTSSRMYIQEIPKF
jgi:TolB-like protein